MKNNKNYNQKLRSARKKLGITQRELAEKLGSSPSAIGMYEQGRRTPDYDTLLKICKILKITAYDISAENEVVNLDVILKALIEYLSGEKNVLLNGDVLNEQKKDNIAYILNLILNDK